MKVEKFSVEPLLGQRRNKKEIKDFLEFNKNEGKIYPNLWNTIKAMLKGKFIALSAYIKKRGGESSHY